MKGRILFVDNNERFVKVRSEFLVDSGYEVIPTYTTQDAEQIFKEEWAHLAIIDLRMVDDDDDADISGLVLAKEKAFRHVPKIILTGFPTFEYVREALGPELDGLPPAVDFIAKKEGPEILIQAVEQAFNKYVRINPDLAIQTNEQAPIYFLHLVSMLNPGLNNTLLINRSNELEDLFRRLFYEEELINLDRLLWQREGRVALIVHTFKGDAITKSFVVICGAHPIVSEELRRYNEHAPKAPSGTGTVLSSQTRTTHFAANVYALANADRSSVRALQALYQAGPEKRFRAALNTLFLKTLAEWHQGIRAVEEEKTLVELYRERLGLTEAHLTRSEFEAKVQAILSRVPTLGTNIQLENEKLNIEFAWKSLSYPDPTAILYQDIISDHSVVLVNTPGALSGVNILTDAEDRAWLTDFAEAGLAPLLWNYTTLEAAIRFDWSEANDLERLHEMEHCLAVSRFGRFDMNLVEPAVKKPLRAIQSVRKLASSVVGKDETPYHLGVLLQAASRIAAFEPEHPCAPNELARLAHVLIAMAILSEKISQDSQHDSMRISESNNIRIDKQGAVWVRGMRLAIRGQSLDLLQYLYHRAGQVCKREEIAEHVFYIEDYQNLAAERKKSEENRMNAAVRRLREKIEYDPGHPLYILTEPGVGYRLVRRPKT